MYGWKSHSYNLYGAQGLLHGSSLKNKSVSGGSYQGEVGKGRVKVPRIRTKYGARAFSVSGPTYALEFTVAKNISYFRKLLKTHFFDLAFLP